MLELGEDEGRLGDGADFAGADHYALRGLPALGYQGEAALALVTHGAQQCVSGPGVRVEFPAAGWLPHRNMNTVACAFVAGVGQHGQAGEERADGREDLLASSGDVVDATGQDVGHP